VLPAGAGAKVCKGTTAVADAGEAGRWGHDGKPSGTSGEHYQTEPPQLSSSLLPCGCGSHRPR
jgi:hypothetical protein